jgi:aminoglycoside 6'-N-acetyltransferase
LSFEGIRFGPLFIRPLTDSPVDVATMARWLSDPTVLEFYEGRDCPFDEHAIRTKFLAKLKQEETPCIVEYEGKSIGYLQFYPIDTAENPVFRYPAGMAVYGMDQFIGEPALWNRGIGTLMVGVVLSHLISQLGAERVVLDPIVGNTRAIRSYTKCGFRKVKVLPEWELHEGQRRDSWLMAAGADTAVAPEILARSCR